MGEKVVHLLACCAKADNVVNTFCPGSQSAFLMSAMQEGSKVAALFDV